MSFTTYGVHIVGLVWLWFNIAFNFLINMWASTVRNLYLMSNSSTLLDVGSINSVTLLDVGKIHSGHLDISDMSSSLLDIWTQQRP